MEPTLAELTDSMVSTYLGYRGGPFIIITDNSRSDIADSVRASAERIVTEVRKDVRIINLDDWRNGAPLTHLPDGLKEAVESGLHHPDNNYNLLVYLKQAVDEERPAMEQIANIATPRGKVGGLPNCTFEVLKEAYHPQNNPDFGKELFDFISNEECVLFVGNGTKLFVDINNTRFTPVNSDGILIPGKPANIIPGEVYVHPENADGKYVINSSYGPLMDGGPFAGNYPALEAILARNPIIWKIKHGRITDVGCSDKLIRRFVLNYVFEKDTKYGNGDRIGEGGFPTNLYMMSRKLTGNTAMDEKAEPHIGHGKGHSERTRCDYESSVHGDALVNGVSLFAVKHNKWFMLNGIYRPEVFVSLRR
ncbi:MAG: hypothetical protein AABX00_01050 [Nanoarchaeota archaeon]